jgi:hypothetical protein
MKESHEQARLQQQGLLEQQQQLLEQQQKQIQQTQKAIKEQAQKESSKPETIAVEVFQKLQSEHDQSVAQNAECQHELRKLRDEINQLKSTHQAQLQQVFIFYPNLYLSQFQKIDFFFLFTMSVRFVKHMLPSCLVSALHSIPPPPKANIVGPRQSVSYLRRAPSSWNVNVRWV